MVPYGFIFQPLRPETASALPSFIGLVEISSKREVCINVEGQEINNLCKWVTFFKYQFKNSVAS